MSLKLLDAAFAPGDLRTVSRPGRDSRDSGPGPSRSRGPTLQLQSSCAPRPRLCPKPGVGASPGPAVASPSPPHPRSSSPFHPALGPKDHHLAQKTEGHQEPQSPRLPGTHRPMSMDQVERPQDWAGLASSPSSPVTRQGRISPQFPHLQNEHKDTVKLCAYGDGPTRPGVGPGAGPQQSQARRTQPGRPPGRRAEG